MSDNQKLEQEILMYFKIYDLYLYRDSMVKYIDKCGESVEESELIINAALKTKYKKQFKKIKKCFAKYEIVNGINEADLIEFIAYLNNDVIFVNISENYYVNEIFRAVWNDIHEQVQDIHRMYEPEKAWKEK